MSFSVLIPARLASTRLPDKPLADIGGLPMVVRVAQRAQRSRAERVVVAADDARIVAACTAHGIEALLTRKDHASGSDRLAEACNLLGLPDDAIVVNVQGDEPLIEPALIDAVAATLAARPAVPMSTAAHPIDSTADFVNPNVVKTVLDANGTALYFSRAPIPWWRDGFAGGDLGALPRAPAPLRHIGIYGYRAGFLRAFPALPQAPLETCEALEQLRALWHGHVDRAADHGMRVNMRGMGAARGQNVDPQAVQAELRAFEVELAGLGEGRHVPVECLAQLLEGGEAPGQVGERRIGGVARVSVLARPALTGHVVLGDRAACRVELADEVPAVGLLDLGAVEAGDQEAFDPRHANLTTPVRGASL